MNLWLAIGVFLVSFTYDVIYIFFVRCLIRNQKLAAALFSGLMQALIVFEVIMYGRVTEYAIPTIIGAIAGTPVAMWLDDRLPKAVARDKRGRFRDHPDLSKVQPSQPELKPL